MISRHFRITVALLALAAMSSLHVSAGQVLRKADPKMGELSIVGATYLKCRVISNRHLQITNSTSSTIAKGTTIHFFLNTSIKAAFVLPYELKPGRPVYPETGSVLPGDNPKAWYFK